MVARVFDEPPNQRADTSTTTKAAEWCADNGAKVINMSLGGDDFSKTGEQIYKSLEADGVLVVAAGGNGGNNDVSYPAGYDSVMAVASVDEGLVRSSFSQYNSKIDISAPGSYVLSTTAKVFMRDGGGRQYSSSLLGFSPVPAPIQSGALFHCGLAKSENDCNGANGKICLIERGGSTFKKKADNCEKAGGIAAIVYNQENFAGVVSGSLTDAYGGFIPVYGLARDDGLVLKEGNNVWVEIDASVPGYEFKSGTSMAAPHVAGTAARMWAARRQCTRAQIREALEVKALDRGATGRDNEYGHGVVQAVEAYRYLQDLPPPCGDVPATPNRNDQGGTSRQSRLVRKKPSQSALAKLTLKLGDRESQCRGACRVGTRYLKGSRPKRPEIDEFDHY